MDAPERAEESADAAARLDRALSALYYAARRDYETDLSHRAIRVLQMIAHRADPPRLDDIAKFLGCAPSTASELMKRLQRKALVTRGRSDSDERVVEIELTEAGRAVLLEHTSLDRDRLRAGLAGLAAEERETLIRLAARVAEAARGPSREGE